MMRKLSIVLTAVALMAVLATAAFAQPNFSGQVLVRNEVTFPSGGSTSYTWNIIGYVNASGSVSDQVSYYARVQGSHSLTDKPSSSVTLPYAYIDVKNLVGEGSTLRLGRQSIAWEPSYWFGGLISYSAIEAASLTLKAADNVNVQAFAQLAASKPSFGGRVALNVGPGTLGLKARSSYEKSERKIGYAVDADFEFAGVHVNAELGKKPDAPSDKMDIQIVGLSFDAIKDATGWNNWIEYNANSRDWAIRLGKTHDNKLTTNFTVYSDKAKNATILRTDVSVSF